ncbi:tRNA pseudouridine(55) synthase TruB [Pontibacillus marinus]|uniref:tRNA pseudouridine synthase B n=1 Tax=Pontibacillus marinus BH030004 = DSM 16465 TaxID=1385511 RepID=A0A0A5HYA3_9BACI|nr:tRNA pseudouridine(55) synthase TruB [Pontibacillus marinus]KGX88592.1 tRNA pseudouridine synthase B [Pontibacillus marinus BH030004 = DSM 16465]
MDGILPLWKPVGMTSHDCVNKMRKILGTKKVGHTGTLDPEVAGMLPMCIGMGTKIAQYVTESKKVYEAEVKLGYATETEDAEGAIIDQKSVSSPIAREELEKVLESFVGTITQVPPMYSAVRVEGKRLYEYAREGLEVERPQRTVTIYDISLLSDEVTYDEDGAATFNISITCSKGTYIRTLCVDIGKALGYPAHMSHLVRTASGSFEKEEGITFEQIETAMDEGRIEEYLQPMERGVRHLDRLYVKQEEEDQVYHGTLFSKPKEMPTTNPFSMISQHGKLLAIYQIHPDKPHLIKPVRVFQYD